MPAASPWIDQAVPAQWSTGYTAAVANVGATVNQAASGSVFDTTLHLKVAGTIILGLIVIFGLQAMGFRFVTSATVGIGR